MPQLTRITRDPPSCAESRAFAACASRSARLSASLLPAARATRFSASIPYLEAEDIAEALSYAAWRAEEVEVPLRQP